MRFCTIYQVILPHKTLRFLWKYDHRSLEHRNSEHKAAMWHMSIMTHVPDTQNWPRPPFVSGTSGPVIQSVVSRYDVRTHSQPKSASMELPETGKFSYERASLPSGLAYDRYLIPFMRKS